MACRFLLFVALTVVFSAEGQAQFVRAWVSAVNGADTNPCTRSAPCRNFGSAVAAVDSGGEVVVLDSGGYGAVTINKSVSIIAPQGLHAAVAPTVDSAITIDIPGGNVILRNLYLNSQGALIGIDLFDAAAVHLEGLVVNGFPSCGLFLYTVTQSAKTYVKDSIVRHNGIALQATTELPTSVSSVSIDRSRFENNLNGILVQQGAQVHLRQSLSVGNSQYGARIVSDVASMVAELTAQECSFLRNGSHGLDVGGGAGSSIAAVSDSIIANNTLSGVTSRSNGVARLSGNTITRNTTGVSQAGGTVNSSGTNYIDGNTTETSGTITPIGTI